jgi:tRNA splicing ligase
MARAGMSDLIAELRGMTDAGTADYTVGTVSYWSDDHLQTELDYHRNEFKHILIESNPTVIAANALEYKEFILSYQNIESGTVFYVHGCRRRHTSHSTPTHRCASAAW